MIACMGGFDVLFLMAIMIVAAPGLLFFSYWPYRSAINALARGPLLGKPLGLFAASLGGAVIWAGATYAGVALWVSIASKGNESLFVVLLVLAGCGTLCWAVMLLWWLAGRIFKKNNTEGPTPSIIAKPRMQVWFQDLLIAVLCYGAGLTIVSTMNGSQGARAEEFLPQAVYLVIAGSLGFLVALDVARSSPSAQKPLPRAAMFVSVFTLFPVTLPLALFAYWRWRRSYGNALN